MLATIFALLFSIIATLATATLAHYFNYGGQVFKKVIVEVNGEKVIDRKMGITKAGVTGWMISFAVGLTYFFGVCNAWSFKQPWLALPINLAIIGALVYLTIWWIQNGAAIKELVLFLLISLGLTFIWLDNMRVMSALWDNLILTKVAGVIPILGILAVGAIVISNMLFYHYHDNEVLEGDSAEVAEEKKAKADCFRASGWITRGVAILVAIVVLVSVLAGCGAEAVTEEAINNLTVTKLTPEDLEKLNTEKYAEVSEKLLASSLGPHDKERTASTGFSDALTYGFKAKDSQKMFLELEEEILRNPVYGVTVANALKDKKIGDKTIGSFNSWMDEMVERNKKGVFVWCEYRNNDTSTIYVTTEYRCYAATLCTLLERLVDQGVQSRQTIENWPLNGSAKNNDRAGIKASYQYKKEALILAYIGKQPK